MKTLKQELESRGLLYQTSSEDLFEKFEKGWEKFYCGFDPTADSLHLGNFIGFMVAIHVMRRGNSYTALTGWATGMIGDPGWKDTERNFLSPEALDDNQKAIESQMTNMLANLQSFTWEDFQYDFVNNKDFYEDMSYLDFLREVGKFITVNNMISKDTVKKRIEDPKQSISYTEFSYMLLQGYDFAHMYETRGMLMQIGGQDQWGNLVTWSEIIRKKHDGESYVLTWPLITDAAGKKFGKSEGNALWLDKTKTTPYSLYQYFMNTSDDDIEKYLKMLTLIEVEDIEQKVADHSKAPEDRAWQKLLAYSVVEIIHGSKEAEFAKNMTQFMFSKTKVDTIKELSAKDLVKFQAAMGGFSYNSQNLFETIVESGLAASNSEARNAVKSGAISINEVKIDDFNHDIANDFLSNGALLIQKGKKNLKLILK